MEKRLNIMKNWGKSVFSTFIKYDSQKDGTIVNEHISPTGDAYILFENEGIIVVVKQDKYCLDFYTADEEYIISTDIPIVEEGRKAYLDVCCDVDDDYAIVKLPVYQWIDNYPHCDGESDRWDTKIIGYHVVKFDMTEKKVRVELFK